MSFCRRCTTSVRKITSVSSSAKVVCVKFSIMIMISRKAMIRIRYKGNVIVLKGDSDFNRSVVATFQREAKELCLRFEVFDGLCRKVYYYDKVR